MSFDVLSEAGRDDARPLSELARLLKPGGHLLLRLPAYHWLRGILSAEAPLVRSIGRPFGLTVVTLAMKESE